MDRQRVKLFKVKSLEESAEGSFGGYASTFGNADREGDVMMKGCFSKSIEAKTTYPLCYNHDTNKVIGKVDVREDEKGLYAEGLLNLESDLGREVHALLKMGAIDSFSIGFLMEDFEENDNSQSEWMPSFNIKQADLLEVSLVTIPCNPEAMVSTVKSHEVNVTIPEEMLKKAVAEALWERDRKDLLSELERI